MNFIKYVLTPFFVAGLFTIIATVKYIELLSGKVVSIFMVLALILLLANHIGYKLTKDNDQQYKLFWLVEICLLLIGNFFLFK